MLGSTDSSRTDCASERVARFQPVLLEPPQQNIDAILADGTRARFDSKRPEDMQPAVRALADKVAALAVTEQDEIARMYPKVLRRVGGYNLDIFFPQSERPYTTDNSVNLAHLLVGSEGTLAVSERLTLKLSALPKHKTLGVVNFPSFYKAMETAQHIVKLKPTAVELVDRTMIELARANPLRVVKAAGLRRYWGDLHGQSGETIGMGSAEDYFRYARDAAFVDMVGHQGNDFQITDAFWKELNRLTAEFDKPGKFVGLVSIGDKQEHLSRLRFSIGETGAVSHLTHYLMIIVPLAVVIAVVVFYGLRDRRKPSTATVSS